MKRREELYRPRKDGEVIPAAKAIRFHCSECFGHQPAEVRECTSPACWLFPWRNGRPPELKRKSTPEVAAKRAKALARAREAR